MTVLNIDLKKKKSLKKKWLALSKMTRETWQIFTKARLKIWTFLGSFIQSRKCMSSNFTRDLCVMKIKNDVKFEQKLAGQFKTDMRNLTIFWLPHSKISIISTLMGWFWPRYIMFEHSRLILNLKENWLVLPKMT